MRTFRLLFGSCGLGWMGQLTPDDADSGNRHSTACTNTIHMTFFPIHHIHISGLLYFTSPSSGFLDFNGAKVTTGAYHQPQNRYHYHWGLGLEERDAVHIPLIVVFSDFAHFILDHDDVGGILRQQRVLQAKKRQLDQKTLLLLDQMDPFQAFYIHAWPNRVSATTRPQYSGASSTLLDVDRPNLRGVVSPA